MTQDYILGMDHQNIRSLNFVAPNDCRAKISLLGEYDDEKDEDGNTIWDPYFVSLKLFFMNDIID